MSGETMIPDIMMCLSSLAKWRLSSLDKRWNRVRELNYFNLSFVNTEPTVLCLSRCCQFQNSLHRTDIQVIEAFLFFKKFFNILKLINSRESEKGRKRITNFVVLDLKNYLFYSLILSLEFVYWFERERKGDREWEVLISCVLCVPQPGIEPTT